MSKKIYLTEEQFRDFIKYTILEGVEYTASPNGSINFHINSKQDDKSNREVDTRVFGKAGNILNGDGTTPRQTKNLSDTYMDANSRAMKRRSGIEFVKNGYTGKIDYDDDDKFKKQILAKRAELEKTSTMPDEDVIKWLETGIDRDEAIKNIFGDKYARVRGVNKNKMMPRYNIAKVPGTNIDVIALFLMNDFNFSDALKHGKLRQNDLTDELLGITKDDRETVQRFGGKNGLQKIDVTYDDNITPDIANNFSLDNSVMDNPDHYKKQFGYGDENYTSVTQFIDKSVLTACYALKKIDYMPQYIVAAPSSSRFNEYYCINLSRKLGVPYVKDFFKRNVINLEFDNQTQEDLKKAGATDNDVEKIKRCLINGIYSEIAEQMRVPIKNFVNTNLSDLSNIKTERYGRVNVNVDYLTSVLTYDICKTLYDNVANSTMNSENMSTICRNITRRYANGEHYKRYYNNPEAEHIMIEVGKLIQLKIGQKVFTNLLQEVTNILLQYNNKIESGYTFNPNNKAFKIVDIEQRFRRCIHNVYVIADKELNKSNNELLTRYKNANFLIFDDDMNSGATLKLVCDALQDKIDNGDNKIKCLVNGYSFKGR